jgi:GNAT superfamily N-acetyltransferase
MQETLTLREARSQDLSTIAEFWLAMFEEVGKHREEEFAPGWRDRFVTYFTGRIERAEAAYYLAEDRGRIAGTAGALLTDGYPSAIHKIRSGYVFGVYVLPEYRGQGLATRLTERTVAFLQAKHPWAIRLHASPYGRPIYERLGFTPTNEMQLRPDPD